MIKQYPLWKYALVALVVLLGVIFVFSTLLTKGPTVLIQSQLKTDISPEFQARVKSVLAAKKIKYRAIEVNGKHLFISFLDTASQTKAVAALEKAIETRAKEQKKINDYIIYQIMPPSTLQWTASKGTNPLYLGFSKQDGVHARMEVDFSVMLSNKISHYKRELRKNFIKKRMRNKGVWKLKQGLRIKFTNNENRTRIASYLSQFYKEFKLTKSAVEGVYFLEAVLSKQAIVKAKELAMTKNIQVMSRRIDELGIGEIVFIRQGKSIVFISLPGVQKPEKILQVIGKQATIESRPLSPDNDTYIRGGYTRGEPPPPGTEIIKHREVITTMRLVDVTKNGKISTVRKRVKDVMERVYLVRKEVTWSSKHVLNAIAGFSTGSGPSSSALHITLDDEGGKRNRAYASKNLNKRSAIVFIETVPDSITVDGKLKPIIKIKKSIVNVAYIRSANLYKRFEISGLDDSGEARKLAVLLRSGPLAAPMKSIEIFSTRPGI